MPGIIRTEKNSDYSVIKNTALKDPRLSWGAKGLFSFLMSLPDDWKTYVAHLQKVSTDGRDATAGKLKELINAGYILKGDPIREDGKFKGYDYTIYEDPQPLLENRNGLTVTDNPELLSTKGISTNILPKGKKESAIPFDNPLDLSVKTPPEIIDIIQKTQKWGLFGKTILPKPGQKPTKTLIRIEKFLLDMKDGRLPREYTLNEEFRDRHSLNMKKFKNPMSWAEVESALHKACRRFRTMKTDPAKWPMKKDSISAVRFADFLFNEQRQTSWFFLCHAHKPWNTVVAIQTGNIDRLLDEIAEGSDEASAAAAEQLLDAYPNWSKDKSRISLRELWEWWENKKEDLKFYNNNSGITSAWDSYLGRFAKLCDYLKEFYSSWDNPNPQLISPEGNAWGYFENHMKSKYGIDLNPDQQSLRTIKEFHERQRI